MPQFQETGGPVCIEYSPEAVEVMTREALEGLLALPRIGMGVGGFLLGHSTPDGIRISQAVAIPCSHSTGPSFALNTEESALAATMIHNAAALGLYYSKPRGLSTPTEAEARLFSGLFPGDGKLLVQIKPSTCEPTLAAVYQRNSAGVLTVIANGPLVATEAIP